MANYVDVNSANWESAVAKSDMLTLVYFWHDECPWCLRLNPIFNEITEEFKGRIKFVKLNILESETNREMATNLGVMGTPTMMFFCHGRSTGQTVGFMTKEQLEQVLREMFQKYKTCLLQSTELKQFYIV